MILVCTICSELMHPSVSLCVTKCGHLFHYDCLRTWVDRSKSCPQCRYLVMKTTMIRIYPTTSDVILSDGESAATLQMKLDHNQLLLNQQQYKIKTLQKAIDSTKSTLETAEETIKTLKLSIASRESELAAHKDKINYLKTENKQLKNVKEELESHKKSLQLLQGLQKVFNAAVEEVEDILKGYPDACTVATFAVALKKGLCESEAKLSELRNRLQAVRQELAQEKVKSAEIQKKLEEELSMVTNAYDEVKKSKENVSNNPLHGNNQTSLLAYSLLQSNYVHVAQKLDSRDLHRVVMPQCMAKNTMVEKIEDADYLNLKQSNLAWSTMQNSSSTEKLGPHKSLSYSFRKKHKTTSIFREENTDGLKIQSTSGLQPLSDVQDTSYDGLGSHTRTDADTFPKPLTNVLKPKCVAPKITPRHKLKRPASTPNIAELLKKIREQ